MQARSTVDAGQTLNASLGKVEILVEEGASAICLLQSCEDTFKKLHNPHVAQKVEIDCTATQPTTHS